MLSGNRGKTVAISATLAVAIAGAFLFLQLISYPNISAATSYKLPWKAGDAYNVDQGWDEGTHNNTQMKYAYDFGLAEGIEVRAAASGTVAHRRGDVTTCGGYDQRDTVNYVTINHDDGSATLYLHLKEVWVSDDQEVQQGQPIGLSGKTGYTDTGSGCYPHLHFQRQEQGIWIDDSQQIFFDEYPGEQLNKDRDVTSQNKWGDCSTDGKVNIFDVSILMSNWNKPNPKCDLNADGKIDVFDLSIMLRNWTG